MNEELLKAAIQDRTPICAKYGGYYRELSPHALGYKNGKLHLLSYQTGGESSSGPIVPGSLSNWRCMDVSAMSAVALLEADWGTAANHSRPQNCIDEIIVEVVY